jgi:hypothetical protein
MTTLLADDGGASMATALMMSHHAFRRDLARFRRALETAGADRAAALRGEWESYRAALHGHHTAEDTGIFPSLRAEQARLALVIDSLTADHQRIDPLLRRADALFPDLPGTRQDLLAVLAELDAILQPHLATEEEQIIPFLRAAKAFPAPAGDAEAEMYAQGFAWASQGIAPAVLERVYAMLPQSIASRLPTARDAFEARTDRVWGAVKPGASRTPVPEE